MQPDRARLTPAAAAARPVNGKPTRALINSGSFADLVFLLLAVQGSKGKISTGYVTHLQYQGIACQSYFDVANIINYDLILGTPFLWQHKITVGFNPLSVVIGSVEPLWIEGMGVRHLESHAADLYEDHFE
ncbi:hypothetical protein PHLGIDRAFT_122709 [Phlebiopsis gigantea 11061_1 CR5-6]|uniref:Uncharacterized protein n=1 Tax=Phlebiopsis gigantea (strain 11061_1 CR5-6) TaxID=745531 RepID=A0A0C3RQL8_PHLG1|nr:hypothetical protein PHLGIDRAFT_122709 [Phlebiopsis gigantea 11061_1 CR5-6]